MRILTDPSELNFSSRYGVVSRAVQEMREALVRVVATLDEEDLILAGMGELCDRSISNDERVRAVNEMAERIDEAVDRCRYGDAVLLNGSFSRIGLHSSLWVHVGPRFHDRIRLFLATMTSLGLGVNPSYRNRQDFICSGPIGLQNIVRWARNSVAKQKADTYAYLRRLEFINNTNRLQPDVICSVSQLEQNLSQSQLSMLEVADNSLLFMMSICNRLRELVPLTIGANNMERQFLQVEVSELVDEIDRLASATEYNERKLLTGSLSTRNYSTSLWFINASDLDNMERIFINTMTAQVLNFRDHGMLVFHLSAAINDEGRRWRIRVVDNALGKLRSERQRIRGYMESLQSYGTFNRQRTLPDD
jgi:hypothetical protein